MMADKSSKRSCCSVLQKALKANYRCKSFGFSGTDYDLFPLSQWKRMDGPWYVIYRLIIAIPLLVWACEEIPRHLKRARYNKEEMEHFFHATTWAYYMYTITLTIFALFCAIYACKKDKRVPKCFAQFFWFLYATSTNIIIMTSLIYTGIVITNVMRASARGYPTTSAPATGVTDVFAGPRGIETKLRHSIPAFVVLIDLMVNSIPVRLFHAIYPALWTLIYVLFSCFYYFYGKSGPIYAVQDWSKPGRAVLWSAIAISLTFIIQVIFFLIYVLRVKLSDRESGRGTETVEQLCDSAESDVEDS